jgi:hypothetical protein
VVVEDMLGPALGRLLSDEFPREGFRRSGNSPDYAYWYRGLIDRGTVLKGDPPISEAWSEMAAFLASEAYRQAVERVVGLSLAGLALFAGFTQYEPACMLRPHPDRSIRVVTQTIYFNEQWAADAGGALLVLRSNRWSDVHARIVPELGRSVIFVRSEHSWHAVERVRSHASAARRALLLHFSR